MFQHSSTPRVLHYAERTLDITSYKVIPPGLQVAELLPGVLLLLCGSQMNLLSLNQGCAVWNEGLWANIFKMAMASTYAWQGHVR